MCGSAAFMGGWPYALSCKDGHCRPLVGACFTSGYTVAVMTLVVAVVKMDN
jgi:hypothetical protein